MDDEKTHTVIEPLPVHDELSRLVQEFDWAQTPLGPLQSWNESFQSAVRLCLHSKSPILLVGGREMIQLYNSAFAGIIGSRHPGALGTRAKDFWREQWPEIGPMVRKVWQKGESMLLENHRFILTRKGYPEEMYFTTSYTPVFDSTGIHGIFVTVTETTQLIRKDEHLKYLRNQLVANLFSDAPLALCILEGPDMIIGMANEAMLVMWGKTTNEVLNKRAFDVMPEVGDQGYEAIIRNVFKTGQKVMIPEGRITLKKDGHDDHLFVRMVFEAVKELDNSISGIMILAEDITQDVLTRKKTEESEIRQKLAIEAAAIGTFDWDIPNAAFQFSERLAHIFGFNEPCEADHQKLIGRIHPDDMAVRNQAHQIAFQTGALLYEARVVWPDGSIHWIRMNGKIVFDDRGVATRMYGTSLDITDQREITERLERLVKKRTEALQQRNVELKNSEERYHKMVEEVRDYAIILLDRNGIVQNWNKGAEQIKGFKEHEIVGKHFSVFYLAEDLERQLPQHMIQQALNEGRAMHEGWRMRKDGTRFWCSVAMTTLQDDQGNIIGFTKVTRDLTERRIAEMKMLAYTVELESQNKELEQFAYIASHDLQEPLRKIRTFSDLVQQNLGDEEAMQRYFEKINSSAHRMSELIRSVLAYSRITKESDHFEPVDLNIILANVMTDFELLIEDKKATVIHDKLSTVYGVAGQLSQLFTNLISNALKFTRGAPELRISSRMLTQAEVGAEPALTSDLTYVQITFADNGIGFDQQYEKKIFTMFQRLHRKEHYAGTGIGLALCKKIVEIHQGLITASSVQHKGTSFYVTLPLAPL